LDGVQVLFDGKPAALLYAGPNQINAIVPANTGTTGSFTTAMQIVTATGTVTGPVLAVQPLLPQVFTDLGGFAVSAVNEDGTINSAANPAPFSSVMTVFLTGLGSPTSFDNQLNFKESTSASIAVLGPSGNGGLLSVKTLYAGSAPQQPSGVSQISFVMPDQKYNGTNYMSFLIEANTVLSGRFNIYVK
jgi:uncharacterized protein (TIGR03437 family)